MMGTNVKELKVPPNNPVGQRAYDAVAKAAEGEIVSFTYDFPSLAPAKCPRLRKRSKLELASRHAASVISRRRLAGVDCSEEIDEAARHPHLPASCVVAATYLMARVAVPSMIVDF